MIIFVLGVFSKFGRFFSKIAFFEVHTPARGNYGRNTIDRYSHNRNAKPHRLLLQLCNSPKSYDTLLLEIDKVVKWIGGQLIIHRTGPCTYSSVFEPLMIQHCLRRRSHRFILLQRCLNATQNIASY